MKFEQWLESVSSKGGGVHAVDSTSTGAWRTLLDELISDLRFLGKEFPAEMEMFFPVLQSFWNHIITPKVTILTRGVDVRVSLTPSEFTQLVVAFVFQLREGFEKLRAVNGSVHAAENNQSGGD